MDLAPLRSSALPVALSFLLSASLQAQSSNLAIRDVTVVDVIDGTRHAGQTVLLEGNRIAAVGPEAEVAVPAGADLLDAGGGYLIPGLWDMHVHAAWEGSVEAFYPLFLANGVTGIRDTWGDLRVADAASAAVAAGELPGPPRTIVAGALIDGPARIWPGSVVAITPDDGRRVVDSLHAAGAPFIKVYSSLLPETYFAIAERSRALGIPVVGHVPELVRATDAARAGLRTMEHLYGTLQGCSSEQDEVIADFRSAMTAMLAGDTSRTSEGVFFERNRRSLATQDDARCRDLAAVFAEEGVWQVPTLVTLRGYAYMRELSAAGDPRLPYLPPGTLEFWTPSTNRFASRMRSDQWSMEQAVYRRYLEILRLMAAAGVPILAGSDTPNPWAFPGSGLHDELALMVDAGLTQLHALQAATLNPARYLQRTHELGTVAPGKLADLVLLDADPLEDIRNTQRIRAVIADGRLYSRRDLDGLLAAVAAENARPSIATIVRRLLDDEGIQAARERSRALHAAPSDSIRFGENELNALGYALLGEGRVPEAIAVFEMNVEAYPEAPNPHDSLGDALRAAGRLEDARAAYARAVVLAEQQGDPRLSTFRGKLDELSRELQRRR